MSRTFNLAEELEKERKKNKELEKELKSIKENYKIQLEYDEELETIIYKAIVFIDMDKHIRTNWDNLSNEEKDEFVLDLLNEIENILKGDNK